MQNCLNFSENDISEREFSLFSSYSVFIEKVVIKLTDFDFSLKIEKNESFPNLLKFLQLIKDLQGSVILKFQQKKLNILGDTAS